MSLEPSETDTASGSALFVRFVLLWLAGVALRVTVLAVPPVVPRLHDDLGLSETGIGVLSSLPPMLFAAAALPASLFIARLGAVPTLVAGLWITAIAGAARGAAPDAALLFAATIVMAIGIAVMQPALPQLVRSWVPRRIGFATALYTNGLLVGETLAVALTLPLVLPLVGDSWRWGFAAWSLPVLATGLLAVFVARRPAKPNPAAATQAPAQWWPDWTTARIWKLGLVLGSVNAVYFATNAFIPDYLTARHEADLISPTLTALNFSQVPASIVMLAVAGKLARSAAAYIGTGVLTLISLLGMTLLGGWWIVASATLFGFVTAMTLVLAFALPSLLSAPNDVHRTSAAMITIGYSCAMITPVIGGYLWDATGIPLTAFAPILFWPLVTIALPATIDFHSRFDRPSAQPPRQP